MSRDLSDQQVAQALGKHPRSIQRWCQAGKLPGAYKAGRSWRIPRAALRAARVDRALRSDGIARELLAATLACRELCADLEGSDERRRALVR
ncbi:MAG: helix-turn-helix domain-containing protein, partial [Actinobacteria bacterium]|nr:helix-turn-helix domain-containing protein [Actinomycetota bacterium]